MSSLHQDHLLVEGSEPTQGTGSTLATARGRLRKPVGDKVPNTVPTQRQGKAQRTGSSETSTGGSVAAARVRRAAGATATAAADKLAARAKAAGVATSKAASAKAVTAKAATAKAAGSAKAAAVATVTTRAAAVRSPKAAPKPKVAPAKAAAAAKPVAAKPAAAEKTSPKPATAKPAAARPAAAKPAAAKAAPKPTTAKPATAQAAAKPAAAVPAAAKRVPATADAPVRPTPHRRATAVEASPAAPLRTAPVVSAIEVDEVVASVTDVRSGRFLRRPLQVRRRSVLALAAALVGAVCVSGFTSSDPAAQATSTVSHSVSVAEALGIEAAPSEEITTLEASRQLGELAASRAVRVAEQAEAAQVQAEADEAAKAAAIEAARPKAVLPVQGARLTSTFGPRWGTLHAGIDLAAPMQTPEYAVMDGVVLEAGAASGFGLAVYIQHANGDVTVYGHMDSILVEAGQVVRAGDTIALLGNRGQSTGPHLHFEVHVGGINGQKVDPLPWLRERGVNV